ncbi:RsiV family protein, partial [Lysobacter xanthus]
EFKLKHESPQMVVLAVDGSAYTGGAHGMPMIQRWVWLPPQNRLLTAAELFPQPESWQQIAGDVRTQLQAELKQRLDADEVPGPERAAAMKSATAMIDGGTEPGPDDFAVFEPVLDADGKITALRFVFPPYQVGAYAEGMHTVDLPASRLVQQVAPAYRGLFEAMG